MKSGKEPSNCEIDQSVEKQCWLEQLPFAVLGGSLRRFSPPFRVEAWREAWREAFAGLQNSPYFCVFKYARAAKQKVWNEAENTEQDWGETVRLLRHALPISLLILREKPTVLQSKRSQAS